MLPSRLIGIDLFRAVAAFAVVIIHAAGEISELNPSRTDIGFLAFVQLFRLAVPFFLATSFYLMMGKLLADPLRFSTPSFLVSRVTRLAIPYGLWSLIYLAIRGLKVVRSPEGLAQLFQDPVFLIFLGGSAIHLYFLPLLFTGSLLIPVVKGLVYPLKSLRNRLLLLVVAIALYEGLFVTGNGFNLGVNCAEQPQGCSVAFQSLLHHSFPALQTNPWVRLLSTELAWVIRGWMYIAASVVLHHPILKKWIAQSRTSQIWSFGGIFLLATLGGELEAIFKVIYFPLSLYELGVSFGLLLCGIALSRSLSASPILQSLGNTSFGIYLLHYLVLVFYSALLMKGLSGLLSDLPPILLTLGLATICFVTSWLITLGLSKQKTLRQLLFSG